MKNIASKKDIIDNGIGSKTYIEGGIVPDVYFTVFHLNPISDELPENIEDGDNYTIDGIRYTYRVFATQPNDREIGIDFEASMGHFMEDVRTVLSNGHVPLIEVNITGFRNFVDVYTPLFNMENLNNSIEGDTLTIGEVTYTFKETPTEQYDIDIANPTDNFKNFILNNANEDIKGINNHTCFCTNATSSIEGFNLYIPKGIKKIDISKRTIVLNTTQLEEAFLMPSEGTEGQRLTIINVSEMPCFIYELPSYDRHLMFEPNMFMRLIYLDGWKKVLSNGVIADLYDIV